MWWRRAVSLTGAAADHRLALPRKDIAALARAIHHEVRGLVSGKPYRATTNTFARAVAKDLFANRRRGVLVAGPGQPDEVHDLVHITNAFLDNYSMFRFTTGPSLSQPSHAEAIAALAADLSSGKVETLLVLGGNPAYNAPADLGFGEAVSKAATSIHLGLYRDETSRLCTWHVPQTHFLEAWGDSLSDVEVRTYGVAQPLIEPLYGGKSATEVLALILGMEAARSDAFVRQTFEHDYGLDNEQRWRRTLRDGVIQDQLDSQIHIAEHSELPVDPPSGDPPTIPTPSIKNGELEIIFLPDQKVYDGRFANNGWLQELPDPITALTWDNAAMMSPATAKVLGVKSEDVVKLKYEGREVEAPVLVVPGQADGTVAVTLGYGRTAAGKVGGSVADGIPPVGFNAYLLRTSKAMDFGTGLTVEPTGRTHRLAVAQETFGIDAIGVAMKTQRIPVLVREATLAEYKKKPDFAQKMVEHPPLKSLWKEHVYEGRRWGMTIDLSKCIGCGACVVACQAENNIPIVGREQVLRGRQMQWLRVDRYFRGDPANPRAAFQPVACHHCEMAPCEEVCPVAATTHDSEGLNVMVYNRCVGTRYCSNNCPYKVRRFNFFNYHKEFADKANEVTKMAYNPEVTVRSRGVMEKCTYCLQRIAHAKIAAKNQRRPLRDGEIRTACQQTCPTQAIVFGDLAEQGSAVARAAADDRAYHLLAELNTKPRTAYLARIRNPNPELET